MYKNYYRLLPYFQRLWLKISLGIVLTMISSVFEGASITMLYPVIDKVFMAPVGAEPESRGIGEMTTVVGQSLTDLADEVKARFGRDDWLNDVQGLAKQRWDILMTEFSRRDVLSFLCVIALIIIIAKSIVSFLSAWVFVDVGQRMITNLRNALYEHLQQFSFAFFDRQRSGELISRMINDVQIINNFSIKNVVNLVRDLSSVVIFLFIAFMVSVRLSLIVFIFFPPIFLLVGRVVNSLRRHSKRSQQKIADLTFILQETFSSIRIVKAFAMEEYEVDRFKRDNNRYRQAITKLQRNSAVIRPLSDVMATIVGVALLWYGGMQIIDASTAITTGQFFVFLGALFSTMKPIKSIGKTMGDLKQGVAAVERVLELFDTPLDIAEAAHPLEINTLKTTIRFDHVSFAYNLESEVLTDINFEVKKGEIVALVGPSGAGKTTLVDLLPRFYDPTNGAILIDGIDIRQLSLKSLRRLMGIVTQETVLFNDTIFNNITYGLKEIDREQVYEVARAANAHQFIMDFPRGYDAMVGERGVMLSGGQRQRLTIARALLKNPPILIFDEATSSLDSESEYLVQEAIDRLMENRTVFVIAHRLSTIQHADLILVLADGRIVERGAHAELISQAGLYARLSHRQFRLEND